MSEQTKIDPIRERAIEFAVQTAYPGQTTEELVERIKAFAAFLSAEPHEDSQALQPRAA